MKKTTLILALALLPVISAAGAGAASASEVVRSFRQQIPIANARRIHLDFPVAELDVEPGAGDQVGLDVGEVPGEDGALREIDVVLK
ncbi:MAG TPA: hypothetical protein VFC23_06250 [Thermoanaerobaculia bacterium]|nr:hypothetical protein [Thermoanaerobaculia bacterium]